MERAERGGGKGCRQVLILMSMSTPIVTCDREGIENGREGKGREGKGREGKEKGRSEKGYENDKRRSETSLLHRKVMSMYEP